MDLGKGLEFELAVVHDRLKVEPAADGGFCRIGELVDGLDA